MDRDDSKWAERKRGVVGGGPSPSARMQAKAKENALLAEVRGGRQALPRKAPARSRLPAVNQDANALSDDSDNGYGVLNASPTPRIGDIPLPLRKLQLADVRVPVAAAPLRGLVVNPSEPRELDSIPSLSRIQKDYNDVLKKVKENKGKLPHEANDRPPLLPPPREEVSAREAGARGGREPTPRRTRNASAGVRKKAATPPAQREERITDDGAYVLQPQSALDVMPSEDNGDNIIGDSDAGYLTVGEPDTDIIPTGPAKKKGRIRVVLRKRPMREGETGEDCVEVDPPQVHIGAVKQRVDLTEYKENHDYEFDDSFHEQHTNSQVYASCGRILIDTVFEGGSASCFAYGQTGSGKTHTMIGSDDEPGLYSLAAADIFARLQGHHHVFVSLYEIYCNSLFDLLNYRTLVVAREDANKKVNICGLTWHEITSVDDLRSIIDRGTVQRRTGSTSANEFSSRSHAVLTITLRDEFAPKFCGSLNVVDLAGSERAADTAGNDKQTRLEGAEINKSLLALKECIRGLDERKRHVPFRGSKLTEVLRDSFVGNSRTVMVATISPSSDSVEHTLNTLRYAFRVKGLTVAQVDPSKERNAPRPVPAVRSKSIDPMTGQPVMYAAPLLGNPPKERRKKKSREKRRHRDGASVSPQRVNVEQMEAMENALKADIQTLREEMQNMAKIKDDHIAALLEQNQRLERELHAMKKTVTVQRVEIDDCDIEASYLSDP